MTEAPLLYFCDRYDIPLPPGHKFPMKKYRLLREVLESTGNFRFEPGPLALREDLLRVHTPDYIEQFLDGTLPPAATRRIGFPMLPELVLRTLSSVGATVAASQVALTEGWAGVLAGGTHHAHADFGSGFCVFNDIAVAIHRLLAEARIGRAAVIDLDVHQGDGTAAIFAASSNVFTFSAHGRNNFPFDKRQSSFDLEFENGTTDDVYLEAVADNLPRVWAFEPDIVFYQSGVDGLATDRLGKLALTPDGMRKRDEIVFNSLEAAGTPFVVTLGGGYSEPIEHTINAAATTYETAFRAMRPTLSLPSE